MATTNYNLPTITGNMTADVVRDVNALAEATDDAIKQAVDSVDLSNIKQDVSGIDTRLTTHLADYEYQTATVNGAQIRLTKKSNTNRLLFKVESNVSGSITISTDNGATSKNLVDIDGNAVASLEKGFHEIVLTGNFFILRNKGGLSTADLQALITITNEAEANESVLRTNYVNAVNGADENINLPSTATWNDILNQIPNLVTGKAKVKFGSVTSGSVMAQGQYIANTNTTNGYIIEDSLDFKPNLIVFLPMSNNFMIIYTTKPVNATSYVEKTFTSVMITTNTTASSSIGIKADELGLYVNESGFRLLATHSNANFNYIAIE